MDQAFVEARKQDLLQLKQDLLANIASGNEDFRRIMQSIDSTDEADQADDDMNRKLIDAMGAKNANQLKLIDNAITRIQSGKYGSCLKCGKPIPEERLIAIPYALLCIDCKSKEERRNR
jgi:RNA polymerase-binding protein DksA